MPLQNLGKQNNTKLIFECNRPIVDSLNKLSASGMPAKKTMLMFSNKIIITLIEKHVGCNEALHNFI